MNQIKLWIMIFTFVIGVCVNVYRPEQKTWEAASAECGRNGLEFDEMVLKDIDELLDTEFWIGLAIYVITTPWIEILGCFAVSEEHKVMKSPSIVICQKQCESYQFFGYSESTTICTCLYTEGISYSIKNCLEQNNSTYIIVYKVFSGYVSGNDNGKCTTLFCSGGNNGLTSAYCNDRNMRRASRCSNGSVVSWGIPYSRSQQMCLIRYQLLLPPETYCRLNGHENEGFISWTNVFRAETETKLTQDEAGTHEPIKCLAGSFAEQNDRRELNITRRSCNHQLKFVCRIDTASSTTPTKNFIAIKLPDTDSRTTLHKGNTSAPTQSQSTLDKGTMQTDSSFDIGAVIGGILAACFMIIVLAVLIVCKIRSKGIFTESNTNNYEDTSRVNFSTATYEDLDNTKHTNLTATTNQACDIDDSSAPVYEEVNTN